MRTLELVQLAIELLKRRQHPVSISSVINASCEVDTQGIGVSQSALLNNAEARELYVQNRDWNPKRRSRMKPDIDATTLRPVKLGRDPRLARARLSILTKEQLIARLLATEEAYASLYCAVVEKEAEQLDEEWNQLQKQNPAGDRRGQARDKNDD